MDPGKALNTKEAFLEEGNRYVASDSVAKGLRDSYPDSRILYEVGFDSLLRLGNLGNQQAHRLAVFHHITS